MGNDYRPKLDDWGVYFKNSDGYENRRTTADVIAAFLDNRKLDTCLNPGKAVLHGYLYGAEGVVRDGTEHITGYIKSLERVERDSVINGFVKCDVICATCETESGRDEKLYFYILDLGKGQGSMSLFTTMILVDHRQARPGDPPGKWMSEQPNRYIRPSLRDQGFI